LEDVEACTILSMSVKKDLGERTSRFIRFCSGRSKGLPEEQTAKTLGFERPKDLYRQLAIDGYPVCRICGELHPGEYHRREHITSNRRARGSGGEGVEVPIANAIPLLGRAAEKIGEDVEELGRLRVRLHARRFVTKYRLRGGKNAQGPKNRLQGESVYAYWREQIEPEDPDSWRSLCESYGLDPTQENVVMVPTDYDRPDGAATAPPEPLVALIAAHVLAGGDVEELLAALHWDPDVADRAALYRQGPKNPGYVAGLKLYARHVATIVCGGEVRAGRLDPASSFEHRASIYVWERREQGAADETIAAELNDGHLQPTPHEITVEEVKRLGDLDLD
jgi:hypothetical protein